jgi:hypothetical protein
MRGLFIRPLSTARDVEQVAARLHEEAEVANRREAREQGRPAVHDGAQGAERRIVLDIAPRVPPMGPAEQHVDLHVHEAGQQRDVPEVDGPRARGRRRGIHGRNACALDGDHGGRTHPAGIDVEPAARPEDDGAVAHGTGSITRSR